MVEIGTILMMGVFAALAIHSKILRLSIVYLAVFSLLGAFLYLLYAAPELAIAEAVIGSGLVTLLYLAALKRSRVYTVAVVGTGDRDRLADAYISHVERAKALREIRDFFVLREFELQVVFVPTSLDQAVLDPAFDLVVVEDADGFCAYTEDESYVMLELEMMLRMRGEDSMLRFDRYVAEGSQ